MRVLHVIGSLDPAKGGPPAVAARLAAAQAAAGHAVTVLAEDDGTDPAALFRTVPGGDRVGVYRLPRTSVAALWSGAPARGECDALTAASDVLHLHGVWEPLLTLAARSARSAGVPYVVAPHGMLDPWSLRQKPWKKRLALTLYGRAMLDGGSLHLLNSDEERLLGPLRLRAPTRVIANGVFLAEEIDPLPARGTFHDRRPELRGRPYLLFLGRLHEKKGLDFLGDAFCRLANRHPAVMLVVAGPDDGARAPMEASLKQARFTDRVLFTGPLYGADKWAALADAVCFCLPSRQEGFSIAILEAMAAGVPVVISPECHFPEVADTGAGFEVALDGEAIARACESLLGDLIAAGRMGRNGRRLVEERYTWPKIAEQCAAWYESLPRTRSVGAKS